MTPDIIDDPIISFPNPEIALTAATYMVDVHGWNKGDNLTLRRDLANFISPGRKVLVFYAGTKFVSWWGNNSITNYSFNDLESFVKFIDPQSKTWSVGCRLIRADKVNHQLIVVGDNTVVSVETLTEMLNEII